MQQPSSDEWGLPSPEMELADDRVAATVTIIEGSTATIQLGEQHDEWDFPLDMLPAGVEIGSDLIVSLAGGRPVGVELDREAEGLKPRRVDDRLHRLDRVERLKGHVVRLDEPAATPRAS